MTYEKNILSNLIYQIIKIILSFVSSVLIARVLGVEGKGTITYLFLIFNLLGDYGHIGINNSISYFFKKSKLKKQEVYNTNISCLILIFFIITSLVLGVKFTGIALNEFDLILIIFGLIQTGCVLINGMLSGIYIANEKIIILNKYYLIVDILLMAVIIFLCIKNIFTVTTYYLVYSLALVFKVFLLMKDINMKYIFRINKNLLKCQLRYGLRAYWAAFLIYLNYRADLFLIKLFLDNTQLGIYSIGVNLAELAFLIPTSVGTAFTARLYNMNEETQIKRLTSQTIKYTFYFCLLMCIVGVFMTPLIPIVYGEAYRGSINITKILFAGIVFASIGKVAYSYFFVKGITKVHLNIAAITFSVNIILNIMLIPIYGIEGAAVASTIAYMVYGVLYILKFIKDEKFLIQDFFVVNIREIKSMLLDKVARRKKGI